MEESGPAVLDQPTPPLLCVMEESGPAVLDQPTTPLLCVMEESGPAVLDQPIPPLLCVMESGPAVLDQPTPPLCVKEESGPAVLDQPTPPSSVSCSCAAAQEETKKTPQGNQQLFTSCSGCGDCAISTFLCAPHVASHVTCTCSFVCLLLLLRCVHSVSACHDQSVLPYASW